VIITSCTVEGNTAIGEYGSGGGVNVGSGDLYVTNSQFVGNTALNGSGGGIVVLYGYATISNSVFTDNTAREGGGFASRGAGDIVVNDSRFEHNTATGWSEVTAAASTPLMAYAHRTQCIVENKAATGGGLFADWGDATITNTTFYGNEGEQRTWSGGALAGWYTTTLTHCTLAAAPLLSPGVHT
jgi:hypothetical protein